MARRNQRREGSRQETRGSTGVAGVSGTPETPAVPDRACATKLVWPIELPSVSAPFVSDKLVLNHTWPVGLDQSTSCTLPAPALRATHGNPPSPDCRRPTPSAASGCRARSRSAYGYVTFSGIDPTTLDLSTYGTPVDVPVRRQQNEFGISYWFSPRLVVKVAYQINDEPGFHLHDNQFLTEFAWGW